MREQTTKSQKRLKQYNKNNGYIFMLIVSLLFLNLVNCIGYSMTDFFT